MSSLKRLFIRRKTHEDVDFSAHTAMVKSPPAGQVTDRNDPNHEVWKPQFSTGDQTDEGRMPFFNSGFSACPDCGECNIWRFEEKAGVRPCGETYGTEMFICQTKGCGWRTSFKYDDGVADCTHFETRHWPRSIIQFPVSFMMMWADKHGLSSQVKHEIFTQEITGDKLLEMDAAGRLEEGLKVKRKEAEKVRRALNEPNGALLLQHTNKKNKKK